LFKGIGNLASLVKQAQEMGARMQALTGELRGRRVSGFAGGGMVEVEANGLQEIMRVRIDSKLIEQQDRELIEDLTVAAVNQALEKAREMHTEAMKSLAGGMDLSGLEGVLAKLTGGGAPGKS